MKKRNHRMNLLLWICCCLFTGHTFAVEEVGDVTFEGLERVQGSRMAIAYKHPEADFSVYSKIMLLDVYIAFKKNWKREHRRVSNSDMNRIKKRGASLFRQVFTDVLEEGGYPVVDVADDDVLLVRPAIIELDIKAPDVQTSGMSRTYVTNVGNATLYVELYDSTSGAILGRGIDRKSARNSTGFRMSSSVYNSSEARKIFREWAGYLKAGLDEIQGR
ncbi:MAG: DUF3313 family protein [Gammaproteobacteria bacterium]|nr:DUF3313 family protein [Gammaproteobacteria bacterium]